MLRNGGAVLQTCLCRKRIVDISLRVMRIVGLLVRWSKLEIVFQTKWEIRLSVEIENTLVRDSRMRPGVVLLTLEIK